MSNFVVNVSGVVVVAICAVMSAQFVAHLTYALIGQTGR